MIWHLVSLATLVAGVGGCSKLDPSFTCDAAADCVLAGVQGTCEPIGFCSFPRAACASGRAFGKAASEALAGTCVPLGGLADGGGLDGAADLDGPRVDDAPSGRDGLPGDIVRVGVSSSGEVSSTMIVLGSPLVLSGGELLWLVLYTDLHATRVTAPDGWVLFGDRANTIDNFHSWFYYRVATASEPAEHTFRFNQSTVAAGAIAAYANVDTDAPFVASTFGDLAGNPFTIPSIDVPDGAGMLLAAYTHDEGHLASWATPSGWSEAADLGWVAIFDRPFATSGPAGTVTAVATADALGAGAQVALRHR